MTATIESVISTAQHEVGYVEGGGNHDGNITKYWAELYPAGQGQPWCAAFVRWVDLHASAPDLPISNPYYCPSIVTYARQHKLWLPVDQGSPGDLILFQWKKNGVADHVGRVVTKGNGVYATVEGNTSSGNTGSQNNGGGVYARNRSYTNGTVLGILDYSKLLALTKADNKTPPNLPPRNKVKANPFAKFASPCRIKSVGDNVRFVQWAVGVPVDGQFGKQTQYAVKQFQHYHHLTVDGIVGPQTISALRGVTH